MTSFLDPFGGKGITWTIPLFIWIYISFYTKEPIAYIFLGFSILIISLYKIDATLFVNRNIKTGIGSKEILKLVSNPFSSFIEMFVFFFTIYSLYIIFSFRGEVIGYTLFVLGITSLFYNILMVSVTFGKIIKEIFYKFRKVRR